MRKREPKFSAELKELPDARPGAVGIIGRALRKTPAQFAAALQGMNPDRQRCQWLNIGRWEQTRKLCGAGRACCIGCEACPRASGPQHQGGELNIIAVPMYLRNVLDGRDCADGAGTGCPI